MPQSAMSLEKIVLSRGRSPIVKLPQGSFEEIPKPVWASKHGVDFTN